MPQVLLGMPGEHRPGSVPDRVIAPNPYMAAEAHFPDPDLEHRLPVFVAVNRGCDMKCWYCTEHGENRSDARGRIAGEELRDTLAAAYESGTRTFRFTGGEPTLYGPLPELMRETQALGDDVRIAITTNGSQLERIYPALSELRAPRVFLSIDSYDDLREQTEENGIKLEKWLSPEMRALIENRPDNVDMRINCVLTAANMEQLPKIIEYAVQQGISVKIFELLLRDYFYTVDQAPQDAFLNEYRSVRELLPGLRAQYGEPVPYPGTGGRGMPMFAFQAGDSQIVCFDSNAGSHYGAVCDGCSHFPCQEGLYAITLDSNGVAHPSGCVNEELYVNLRGLPHAEKAETLRRMAGMIGDATMRPDIPDVFATLARDRQQPQVP